MIAPLPKLPFPAVALAREAMATRFEVVLPGANLASLRAAGEEALDEIERLEGLLSLYRASSEIARANARAAQEPIKLSPPVFRLLQHARQLHMETQGAFDITIAPLVRCWGFMSGSGALPLDADVASARQQVGMDLVELDDAHYTVRFKRPGVMLDLGGIGKGYAIDCAVEILREAGVTDALIHGGTSSIYGLGHPPDGDGWKVGIETHPFEPGGAPAPLAIVTLRDESLSVSAVWGKSFKAGQQTFGHIIDPRTGAPADNALLAAIVLPSATEADALTTALLIDGKTGHDRIASLRTGMKTVVALPGLEPGTIVASARNLALLPSVAGGSLPGSRKKPR